MPKIFHEPHKNPLPPPPTYLMKQNLEAKCRSCSLFLFGYFKIDKTGSKTLNEREHGQSKNEEYEGVFLLLLSTFFEKILSVDA